MPSRMNLCGPQNRQQRNPCKTAVCTDLDNCQPEGSRDKPRPALHRQAQPSCPWRGSSNPGLHAGARQRVRSLCPIPAEAPHHLPENPSSEAQILTAWYVDCHTKLDRTKPTKRLIGQEATEITDQLRLRATPDSLKSAIRVQVKEG